MDTLLYAFALSGNLGLFSVDAGIVADTVASGRTWVSIQDDGLYVAYTDDACRGDMKTKACADATGLLADVDTTADADGVAFSWADGDVVGVTSFEDPDHFSFQGGCNKGGGVDSCSHPAGYDADVHCMAWNAAGIIGPERTGIVGPEKVLNFEAQDGGGTDNAFRTQATGRKSFDLLDETVACFAYEADGGAPVAVTVVTLSIVHDAGDGFASPTIVHGVGGVTHEDTWDNQR